MQMLVVKQKWTRNRCIFFYKQVDRLIRDKICKVISNVKLKWCCMYVYVECKKPMGFCISDRTLTSRKQASRTSIYPFVMMKPKFFMQHTRCHYVSRCSNNDTCYFLLLLEIQFSIFSFLFSRMNMVISSLFWYLWFYSINRC